MSKTLKKLRGLSDSKHSIYRSDEDYPTIKKTMDAILFEAYSITVRRIPNHNEVVEALNGFLKDSVELLSYVHERAIFHLFTKEFLKALSKEIKSVLHRPDDLVMEICAGSGLITQELSKYGLNIMATDDGSWETRREHDRVSLGKHVVKMDAIQAIEKFSPKVVIGCWVPYKVPIDYNVLGQPSVRHYFHIGEREGGCTGSDKIWHRRGWNHSIIGSMIPLCIGRTDLIFGETSNSLVWRFDRKDSK